MTPREALDLAIREARARFRYIADPPGIEGDEWDTVAEFERRGGGDCDGWTIWCLARAYVLAPAPVYWFVRGTVPTNPPGHAWAEILDAGARHASPLLWADPTWGLPCDHPGWYSGRTPVKAYPWTGTMLGRPTDYVVLP